MASSAATIRLTQRAPFQRSWIVKAEASIVQQALAVHTEHTSRTQGNNSEPFEWHIFLALIRSCIESLAQSGDGAEARKALEDHRSAYQVANDYKNKISCCRLTAFSLTQRRIEICVKPELNNVVDAISYCLCKLGFEESDYRPGYEGEVSIVKGKREGSGQYWYTNPYFTYDGQWVGGKKHGQGHLSFADGGYYEGSFENGEINGDGTKYWTDGSSYVGQFLSGTKHGQGVYKKGTSRQIHYQGAWEHGKYSGEGELSLPDGDRYVGAFRTHKYHGQGSLTQPSRNRSYVGTFEAGFFEREGELQEEGGAFVYTGQFQKGVQGGQGKGSDTQSGVTYLGTWIDGNPQRMVDSLDLGTLGGEDSYVLSSERLKEEAKNQLNASNAPVDPKKAAAKAAPKKGAKGAEPEPDTTTPVGPELVVTVGEALPQVSVRLVDADKAIVREESGRRFRVSMFRERKATAAAGEDPNEAETLKRPVRFGDKRLTFVDPMDESPVPSGKASPAPPDNDEEQEAPPAVGDEFREGAIGCEGDASIGGSGSAEDSEEWFIPVHLQPGIYWIRVEDITDFQSGCPWKVAEALEMPVRVKPPSTA